MQIYINEELFFTFPTFLFFISSNLYYDLLIYFCLSFFTYPVSVSLPSSLTDLSFFLLPFFLTLNSVNQLIFVMVKCGVLFEVRAEFLNII
jgi:hypothetical protein